MIDGSFYTVVGDGDIEGLHLRRDVVFNTEHEIFKAHFPDKPIVPGVCSIEIIRQLITDLLGGEVRVILVKNMKFLNLMTPDVGKVFRFDIQLTEQAPDRYSAKVVVSDPDTVVVKTSLVCEKH